MFNSGTSLADIAAVTGNRGNDGFGDGNGWWVLIILFALFGGWGNGGYGNRNNSGAVDGYVLASDFSNIERKIDGVNNGLCDGFYAQNTNMLNGFAGVQNTLTQGFAGVNTALVQQGYETRLGQNALTSQLANCCCDIREGISGVNYNLATQANAINTNIERGFANTNFAMAQQNCATLQAIEKASDRVIDYLCTEKTQALQNEVNALRLSASQAQQNEYLISQLSPKCPIPAYTVPNPNCCYNGCGCGA